MSSPVIKLKKVTIEAFRGVPGRLVLALDGKSLCLLGENGRGKSTIVDGLEFWSTGRLSGFEREGYQLDAAVNLVSGGPTQITCERAGQPTLIRELLKPRKSTLRREDNGLADDLSPVPILRHRTMTDFMACTPGEKKRALLDLLGLSGLIEFRDHIVTAANNARNQAEGHRDRASDEQRALQKECGNVSVVSKAQSLLSEAGLTEVVTTEAELLAIKLDKVPAVQDTVARATQVDRARNAVATIQLSTVARWNTVAADRTVQAAAAIKDLISAGKRAIAAWPEPSCPLCLSGIDDRDAMLKSWETRARELADLDERFNDAKDAVSKLKASLTATAEAIRALRNAQWLAGSEHLDALAKAETLAREYASAVARTIADNTDGLTVGDLAISNVLDELAQVAISQSDSGQVRALGRLERLRLMLERRNSAGSRAAASKQVAAAMEAFRDLAEKRIRTAVEDAVAELGATAGNYYAKLVGTRVYSGVGLRYTEQRKGGVEFVLRYDGRHDISPPQRVVSESQLNALGLAFFLARIKHTEAEWRTLVLDDVVNSFDSDHRMGLARLLSEEFSDWQVLFFTHDNMFATLVERFFSGWRFWQIVGWSPTEGPILSEGDPLKRLSDRLGMGEAAADLGGLARFALERGLSRPLERLSLPIRFDRRSLHSAVEYRDALENGLKSKASAVKDPPVLIRMKGESYLVNVGAHDRQADPSLSTNDLAQLVIDLKELDDAFTCGSCGRPMWYAQRTFGSYQCGCGRMRFN